MKNKIKLTKDIEIYNKLLEKAKKAYSNCATGAEKRRLESIFPELKESDDEKIRRCISDIVRKYGVEFTTGTITKEKMLAWLEKQGKQADYNPYKATIESIAAMVERYADNGDLKIFYEYIKVKCKEAVEYDKTYLEKQGEQKETFCDKCRGELPYHSCIFVEHQGKQKSNKVEPKFKVGDWIACEELNTAKIISINCDRYEVEFIDGIKGFPHIDYIDRLFNLWTIEDAKEGDVLSYITDEGDMWILIYKSLYKSLYKPYEGHVHYYAILENDNFSDKGTCFISIDNLKPATKEQCDKLENTMLNAGYKWNKEKLKLEKI